MPQDSPALVAPFKIAWRIKHRITANPESYQSFLELYEACPEGFDEICFFAGEYVFHHGYWPLEDLKARFERLQGQMRYFQDRDVPVGINILSTHGAKAHGPFGEHLPEMPYSAAVGWDGQSCKKIASAASEEYLRWTAELYRLAAAVKPEFLWIDDHICGGVRGEGDFSPDSLAGFQGGKWTEREELVHALNDPGNQQLRQDWMAYQTQVLVKYCEVCAEAARKEHPPVEMGLMTVGFDTLKHRGDFWVDCLAGMRGERARPGHGFYRDEDPPAMFRKLMEVSAQCARYPECVREIQYEFEDWPSNIMLKSRRTMCNEISGAIMSGCTGVAMSHLHEFCNDHSEYLPNAQALAEHKPLWREMVELCRGLPQVGLLPVVAPRNTENRDPGDQSWTEMKKTYEATLPWRWLAQGIPMTGDERGAPVAMLTGQVAPGLEDDALTRLLQGGLIIDDGAVQELWKRGLGEHTGVRPLDYQHAVREVYEDHPLNSARPGDGRSPMWWGGLAFEPLSDSVEVISRLERFDAQVDFGACTTVFENSLGGRVVNLGLDPYYHIGLKHKMLQLQNLVHWAADGALPLRTPAARVAPFLRIAPDGSRFVLMLLNSSFDDLEDLTIELKSPVENVWEPAADGSLPPHSHSAQDGLITLHVPRIPAWSHRVFAGNLG